MAWQGAFIAAGSITTYYFYKMKKNILALRTVSVKKKKWLMRPPIAKDYASSENCRVQKI